MSRYIEWEWYQRQVKKMHEQHPDVYMPTDGIPIADVRENIRGEWELCEDADGEYGVCSICGIDADFSHYGKAYDFCPNCGAKMDMRVESQKEKC